MCEFDLLLAPMTRPRLTFRVQRLRLVLAGHPIDPVSLSSNLPPMVVFPKESDFYETWRQTLVARGVNVYASTISILRLHLDSLTDLTPSLSFTPPSRLNTEVTRITSRTNAGVKLYTRPRRPHEDLHNPGGETDDPVDTDLPESLEEYDEIVLCTLADTAKRLLGPTAGWFERFVLGSAKWSDDVTVTHNVRPDYVILPISVELPADLSIRRLLYFSPQDADYIRKYYTMEYDPDTAVHSLGGRDQSSRIKMGKESFKPFVHPPFLCPRSSLTLCQADRRLPSPPLAPLPRAPSGCT